MPGVVESPGPIAAMPFSLCKAYSRSFTYPMLSNDYANGESQRSLQAQMDVARWSITKRLTSAQLETLLGLYAYVHGTWAAFWFYDIYEAGFVWDPSSVSPTGRYMVRFEGAFTETGTLARGEAQFNLVQLQ